MYHSTRLCVIYSITPSKDVSAVGPLHDCEERIWYTYTMIQIIQFIQEWTISHAPKNKTPGMLPNQTYLQKVGTKRKPHNQTPIRYACGIVHPITTPPSTKPHPWPVAPTRSS